MGKIGKTILIFFMLTVFCGRAFGQTRIDTLSMKLDSLSKQIRGLNHNVDLSVNNLPLKEFIRNMANLTRLNIDAQDNLNQPVTNNFSEVSAKNILLYLAKMYNLDLSFTGNIIHIRNYKEKPKPYIPKEIEVSYDSTSKLLTLDLKNDSLYRVARKITSLTHQNIIFNKDVGNRQISGYLLKENIKNALENLALSNNLILNDGQNGTFELVANPKNGRGRGTLGRLNVSGQFRYRINGKQHLDIFGAKVNVGQVIEFISQKLHLNYFIDPGINVTTNLNLVNVSYDEFLSDVLQRTPYTYKIEDGVYFIAKNDAEGLRETKVIQLMNRSITDLNKIIPPGIQKALSIKEFPDQNSFVVSGPTSSVKELESFVKKIDKVVPMVIIEVLIVDNQTDYTVASGITAGVSQTPPQSGGTLFPGVNYTLSSGSINKLLNSFNGFGVVNLGKVNPNFYITIQAMEDQGILKVRSTPRLSTLNGQEAKMTIGNTEYYRDKQTNFIVNQSTQQTTVSQYKPVNADFKISILPMVSGNKEVTLKISVDQSNFTSRISEQAPPGQIYRDFTSIVRAKNNDMILLGGLEEKTRKETNRGFPLLSRIPILKWIFSNKNREKKIDRLNIFIKPTVIY